MGLLIDGLIIVVYFVAITAIGLYMGRREESLRDFALGGRRVPWWAVMASIIAAETSAATFLGAPGEGYDRRSLAYVQLVFGLIIGRFIVGNAFLKPYYAYEDFPGPKVQSDDEFLAAATERGTTTFHPGCTCRMGPAGTSWAVVDDQLRVHGLEGLRVIDASIMPRMISANLNASTLMIADKASDLIRGKAAPEAVKLAGYA